VRWLVGSGLGIGLARAPRLHPAYGRALEGVVLAGATRFGALVYWRQRAFVRACSAARPDPPIASAPPAVGDGAP